jgi:hypothetical protein
MRWQQQYRYVAKVMESLYRPQEVKAPNFPDNQHMNVVRLSALRTGRLYPQPGKCFWYSFLLRVHFETRIKCNGNQIKINFE